MTRFNYASLIGFIAALGYETETEDGTAQVLGLQGVVADPVVPAHGTLSLDTGKQVRLSPVANTFDVYNDVFLVLARGRAGSEPQVFAFRGTLDAGRVANPNPGGTAHLTFGQHPYVAGTHPLNGGHPAFRALRETNRFWRETDLDGTPEPGERIYESAIGANNHWGNSVGRVGDASLACLALASRRDELPWKTYHALLTDHLQRRPFFRMTLWKGSDLLRWAESPETFRPTLYPGTKGPRVTELQAALNRHGAQLVPDGDWRERTTAALLAFQRARDLTPDAICGPLTWAALLESP